MKLRFTKTLTLFLMAVLVMGNISLSQSSSKADTGSAVEIDWLDTPRNQASHFYNEFKNFKVSISQTENLTNQGISVNWSGLKRTMPGELASNYVQIMQCWGDSAGPSPDQCQWGSPITATENLMGSFAANRDLMRGEDPKQSYTASYLIPPPVNQPFLRSYRVPFKSVKLENTFNFTRFFSIDTSNEVSAVPSGVTGAGQTVFEVQTALEAPHLGCGAETAAGPRSCWLVIVPRGELRADGSRIIEGERLGGSPLSASYWENRIQVPLGFSSLTSSCALGASERRVVGSEMIAAAFTSWQPVLCKNIATFGYSQIGDGEARRQITSATRGSSGLAFISDPIGPDLLGKNKLLYAPVANSAVVVAYNIEKNFQTNSPLAAQNGSLVTDLKLNARLIAKLLTQSYRADVPGGNSQDHVETNPRSLVTDPEFIQLNPSFADFQRGIEPGGLLVALGGSDANAIVWRWLQNDSNARAFLNGQPDPWGMVLNKYYLQLDLDADALIESFPKADLSTYRPNAFTPEPGFSTLDMRPYSHDMLDAALAARRGDPKSKIVWDTNRIPAAFVSVGAQPIGQRFMLAITDLPAAERYGLQVADLVQSNGTTTSPSTTALNQAVTEMSVDQTSGIRYNNGSSITNGYPLTLLTYAAVNICSQDEKGLAEYAKMLEYAVGPGQVSGESQGLLPVGYIPLRADLTAQARSVAKMLTGSKIGDACVEPPVDPEPEPEPTDEPEPPVDPGPDGNIPKANYFKPSGETNLAGAMFIGLALIMAFPGLLLGRWLLVAARKPRNNEDN